MIMTKKSLPGQHTVCHSFPSSYILQAPSHVAHASILLDSELSFNDGEQSPCAVFFCFFVFFGGGEGEGEALQSLAPFLEFKYNAGCQSRDVG